MDLKPGSINPALAAYTQALEGLRAPASGAGEEDQQPSFAALVADAVQDAVATTKAGEAAALQAASGSANLQDVVEAVNAAELSLQTVVALRDRIIAAYQEIARMPI